MTEGVTFASSRLWFWPRCCFDRFRMHYTPVACLVLPRLSWQPFDQYTHETQVRVDESLDANVYRAMPYYVVDAALIGLAEPWDMEKNPAQQASLSAVHCFHSLEGIFIAFLQLTLQKRVGILDTCEVNTLPKWGYWPTQALTSFLYDIKLTGLDILGSFVMLAYTPSLHNQLATSS